MKILWIFFLFGGGGGHHKIGLYLGGHFYAFKCLFLMSRHRMGDIFWDVKISKIFMLRMKKK